MSNIVNTNPSPVTMTSLEIVKFINDLRKEEALDAGQPFPSDGHAELQHRDFLEKVPVVLGEETSAEFSADLPDSYGRSRRGYRLPKREASLMAMSYSHKIQARVWDHMTALEEKLKAKEAAALPVPEKPKQPRVSERYREAAAITRDQLKICKLLGVDEGMAKVITAKEVRSATGLDYTPLLANVTATNNPPLTVKQIAERIGNGASSEMVNSALEQLGFQMKEHWKSPKGQPRSKWVLTEAGREYGALIPYQAEEHQHAGFRPVWHESVIELIQPMVEVAVAQRAAAKAKRSKNSANQAPEPQEATA